MSSSSSQQPGFPAVPFSITVPQQSFRLMELPAELVALVEKERTLGAAGPARKTRLRFKSAIAQSSNATDAGLSQGHLHLCSDDKVWAVKQVSTSNSVYITKTQLVPSQGSLDEGSDTAMQERRIEHREDSVEQGPSNDSDGDIVMASDIDTDPAAPHDDKRRQPDADTNSRPGMTAISQPRNILELVEVDPDDLEIETSIKNMVPVHDDPDHDADEIHPHVPKASAVPDSVTVTLRDVLDNIPAPTISIVIILKKLFAFTILQQQGLEQVSAIYIPTIHLLLRAWKTFLQQCAISGIELDSQEGLSRQQLGEDLFKDMIADAETKEDGTLIVAVTSAILRRFVQGVGDSNSDQNTDLYLDLESDLANLPSLTWKESEIRDAVGTWVLLSLKEKHVSTISVDEFTKQWIELLPDSWAKDCDVKSLLRLTGAGVELAKADNDCRSEVLRFSAPFSHDLLGTGGATGRVGEPVTAAVKNDAAKGQDQRKRKWHEKFAAQRKKT